MYFLKKYSLYIPLVGPILVLLAVLGVMNLDESDTCLYESFGHYVFTLITHALIILVIFVLIIL